MPLIDLTPEEMNYLVNCVGAAATRVASRYSTYDPRDLQRMQELRTAVNAKLQPEVTRA